MQNYEFAVQLCPVWNHLICYSSSKLATQITLVVYTVLNDGLIHEFERMSKKVTIAYSMVLLQHSTWVDGKATKNPELGELVPGPRYKQRTSYIWIQVLVTASRCSIKYTATHLFAPFTCTAYWCGNDSETSTHTNMYKYEIIFRLFKWFCNSKGYDVVLWQTFRPLRSYFISVTSKLTQSFTCMSSKWFSFMGNKPL
jgi:hypothetical protein